jgi:hypothetical protein
VEVRVAGQAGEGDTAGGSTSWNILNAQRYLPKYLNKCSSKYLGVCCLLLYGQWYLVQYIQSTPLLLLLLLLLPFQDV